MKKKINYKIYKSYIRIFYKEVKVKFISEIYKEISIKFIPVKKKKLGYYRVLKNYKPYNYFVIADNNKRYFGFFEIKILNKKYYYPIKAIMKKYFYKLISTRKTEFLNAVIFLFLKIIAKKNFFKNKQKDRKLYKQFSTFLNYKLKKNKKFKIAFFKVKLNNLFVKKLFKILIKKGKKVKIYRIYFNWLNIIKFKLNKNLNKNVYLSQITNKVLPKAINKIITKRGKANFLPSIKKKKFRYFYKLVSLSCLWIKKSFNKRREKTFLLKFFSELFEIRINKGLSLKFKKDFYTQMYKNKKYLKYLKWI